MESSILTLLIIFRVKINVAIYIDPRNGVKIFKKWVRGFAFRGPSQFLGENAHTQTPFFEDFDPFPGSIYI
jgi:hypothetical protein